jgi:hypothetical protein
VTVRVTETDPPLVSVTLDLLRVELTLDRPNWNVERVTVPLNPLKLVSVIVDCADDPGLICSENGFACIAKSGVMTWTKMYWVWVINPLVAFTKTE